MSSPAPTTQETSSPWPAPGEVRPVLPGLFRARMPLPFPPGHVNVWLFEHDGGFLAVDTSIAGRQSRELWEQVLAHSNLGGRKLTGLLITHFHPDHIGQCGWLAARFGLTPVMTRIEWLQARALWYDSGPSMMAQQLEFYTQAGCAPDYISFVEQRGALYTRAVTELPRSFAAIKAGQSLRIGGAEWRVMTGAGHSPDMACLYNAELGVLISADQILPRISPYVGLHAGEPGADPLGDFLASNEGFRGLPAETLVLPSHGEPFRSLHTRLDTLAAHHAERLDVLASACTEPVTAFEAAQTLFPRATVEQTQVGFAIGETLAHLRRLERQGRVVAEPGADGVPRFRRV